MSYRETFRKTKGSLQDASETAVGSRDEEKEKRTGEGVKWKKEEQSFMIPLLRAVSV